MDFFRLVNYLKVLIPSIGQTLKCKNINPEIIPHRLPIQLPQDTHTFSINSEQIHQCLNDETSEENVFIPQCMKSYLKQALFYYERKRYGYSLCLLWPLLEHSLRCIFADVNNCQYRVLTAESTSLYTTFDEILSKTLTPDEENKLVKMIGEGCMDLLYDVLVYPEGPRLRDRLSHGETDLSNISQHWIDKTFHIFIYLIYEFQFKNKLGIPESIIDFKFKIKEYESQYHPIALLKKKVQCVTTLNCNILEWIKIDPTLNSWECQEGFDVFVNENTSYKELETEIKEFIKNQKSDVFNSEIWYCEVFKNNIDIINVMLSRKISTLYRFDEIIQNDAWNSSKKIIRESEVVNLLLRINLELETVMVQIKSICLSRQEKLYNKQLRSRQRDNTQKLLYCLPVIHLSIHFVCVITVYHLYKVQSYTQHHFNPLQRCLKLTLKFSENLRTFTGSDKNKWQESMELCVKNIKSLCNFLTELHRS